METRPPALIEAVVRLLLPADAREHVLGDLAERYTSPRRYVAEAARALPVVVASRIRRTANPAWLLLPGLLFMTAFSAGPGEYVWIRGAIPTVAVILSLILRDAYRIPNVARPWRQGLADVIVVTLFVLASQTVLAVTRPEWMVVAGSTARFLINLLLLFLVRVQNPIAGLYPRRAVGGATMSLGNLHREIAVYEQGIRRAVGIEFVTGGFVVLIFTAVSLFAPAAPMAIRVGCAMTAAGGLFVVWRMWTRLSMPPIPTDVDFSEAMGRYRARLEHQHRSLRTMWRWYAVPLGLGPTLIFAVAAGSSSTPLLGVTVAVGAFIAMGLLVDRVLFARQARSLRQRIDALALVTEER